MKRIKSKTLRGLIEAFLLSAVFTPIKILIYYLGDKEIVFFGVFIDFILGALGLFLLMLLNRSLYAIVYGTLCYRYPTFEDAHLKTGITWREYRALTKHKWKELKELNKQLRRKH